MYVCLTIYDNNIQTIIFEVGFKNDMTCEDLTHISME